VLVLVIGSRVAQVVRQGPAVMVHLRVWISDGVAVARGAVDVPDRRAGLVLDPAILPEALPAGFP
jgi:hypothetical protein